MSHGGPSGIRHGLRVLTSPFQRIGHPRLPLPLSLRSEPPGHLNAPTSPRKLAAPQLDRSEQGLERIAKEIQESSPLTLSSECHQSCQTGRPSANPFSRVLFTLSPECQIPCHRGTVLSGEMSYGSFRGHVGRSGDMSDTA